MLPGFPDYVRIFIAMAQHQRENKRGQEAVAGNKQSTTSGHEAQGIPNFEDVGTEIDENEAMEETELSTGPKTKR